MSVPLENIFRALGGLGLLLFGMKMVSSGLEVAAGDRLQNILTRATSNRFLSVIFGVIATIIANSSTVVTIITVGLVNSGLLTLVQSIGVIMGANVGTTFSAQLIAFRIDAYAPLFIFAGIVMHLFFKRQNIRNIGYVILGFGVLLFSIGVMSSPLRAFAQEPAFQNILTTFNNPFLALLAGFVFTAVVQSSTATSGLLVTMHLSGVPITFEASAFILLGTNIGTSITTVIASIPASRDSKRAALFHITYDIIGSLVFGTLILVFPGILNWFQATWTESARQVAMFHTLYNVATMLLLLPFVRWIAKLMQAVVPMKQSEKTKSHEKRLIYLDNETQMRPAVAVMNAGLEVNRMGKIVGENLSLALESFFEKSTEKAGKTIKNEKIIDYLNKNITSKLVKINHMQLSLGDTQKIGVMFKVLSDIERIGDHAENIAEYTLNAAENNLKFSDAAIDELRSLGDVTIKVTNEALDAYSRLDISQLQKIKSLEKESDKMSATFVENHIRRLKADGCEPESGVVFTDMITDLERIADHANNIVKRIKRAKIG